MRVRDAIVVGVCQAIATIPGISRSGATITAGISTGLDCNFSVKFSLLLSIPAVVGANLIYLVKALQVGVDVSLLLIYVVGMLMAAVFGYFSIRLLQLLTRHGKLGKIAYYCWGAGIIIIILSVIF